MHRTSRLLTSMALAVPLALSATGALAQSPTPVPVLDVEWSVSSLDGEGVPADAAITATFASSGALSGSGGCNSYNATWTSDGVTLTVTDLAATLKLCDDDVSTREQSYFTLLQAATGWSLDGSQLIVTTDSGSSIVYGEDDAQPTEGIEGTWTLASIDGEPVPDGVTATAIFGADGSLTGSGGCNDFSGTYTIDGSALTVGPLAATLKLCADSSDTEAAYFDALQGATSWSTTGGGLVLQGTGELVFTGEGGSTGDITLTSQEWWVLAIDGESFDPTLGASATFGEDGSLTGSGGCNRFMGSYTLEGDALTVSPLAATRMACAPHIMDAEAEYLEALQAATSVELVGDTLYLGLSDGGAIQLSTWRDPGPAETTTPEPTPSAAVPTGGIVGSWTMTEYAGTALPGIDLAIDITFADDGTFAGFGGCNDYMGEWTLDGEQLSISGLENGSSGSCDQITQGLEQGYFALLPFIDRATIGADGSLELVSTLGGNQGFTFAPAS